MTVFTEGRWAAEFVLSEDEFGRSRENLTIAAEQNFAPGTPLGRVSDPDENDAAASAAAGNTGQGEMTLAGTATSSAAKNGRYVVTCIEPATNGGRFSVEDPRGVVIGAAVVGAAFDGEVKFTIADGDPDFAAGDRFFIDVTLGGLAYKQWDPDATDGSQVPVALALYEAVTGEDQTIDIAGLVRAAQVNSNIVSWPTGTTDAEKAAAVEALTAAGIIFR